MPNQSQGWLSLLLLIVAALLTPLPSNLPAAVCLGLAGLALEGYGVQLTGSYRLNPAATVYLASALAAGVGMHVVAICLLLDGMRRLDRGFLITLGQSLGVAIAVLLIAVYRKLAPPGPDLAMLIGPVAYLAFQLGAQRLLGLPASKEEKLVWFQLHLQARPLELGLAAAAPVLAVATSQLPFLALALVPVLAASQLGGENVLLKAHDQTVGEVLTKLKDAQVKERQAARERDSVLQEKQLLEGFAQHLAAQPDLEETSRNLVATVRQLMPADNVVVFLGSPPQPFSYRVSEAHQQAMQGWALTGLREPVVDRAREEKKPVLQKEKPEDPARLMRQDLIAAALPLGSFGVLYVGRESETRFSKPHLEKLRWLAGKAALGLEAAYGVQEAERQKRQQQLEVKNLQHQVNWLANLMRGAEEMASSLELEVLCERFASVLQSMIPHGAGTLLLPQREFSWGGGVRVKDDVMRGLRQAARPLWLDHTRTSRHDDGLPFGLGSPLLAGKDCVGVVTIVSAQAEDLSKENADLLFLLSSQAAMAFSHAQLFSEVVEARRQLEESQAQLVQSSKMTALGQLAAGVAHELNSPMGAIALYLDETAAQAERPDLVRKFVGKGQIAVERSKAIVDRLLAYSRQPSHHRQAVSLHELARDTLEFLAFGLNTAGIATELEGADTAPVSGEPQPLQQVLTNLIMNATQAMEGKPQPERKLTLRLANENGHVRLDVADRGCGIEAANIDRIFEPFFTTKPIGQGTGLGLWASHQIVAQHGGTLTVQSRLGEGTTFTLRLPARQAATPG